MKIRKAVLGDFTNIIKSLKEMSEEASDLYPEVDEKFLSSAVLNTINSDMCIVAYNDKKQFCGSIGAEVKPDWFNGNVLHAQDLWIYVPKSKRGTSAGHKLIKEYLAICKKADLQARIGQITGVDTDKKDAYFERIGMNRMGSLFII